MIRCIYGIYALKNDDGDICVLCDTCINYPLNSEMPLYEQNIQPKLMNVNKGECLGCCPMEIIESDNTYNIDPYNNATLKCSMVLSGANIADVENVENILTEDIDKAIEEGKKYGKER